MSGDYSNVVDAKVIPFALAAMYLVAAFVRYKAAMANTYMRTVYLVSIPLALFLAVANIWLGLFGDAEPRREVVRVITLFVLPVIWIAPPVEAIRSGVQRERENRASEELLRDIEGRG